MFLRPLIPLAASVWAVAEPDQHNRLPVDAIIAASGGVARRGPFVTDALRQLPKRRRPARVLICGSSVRRRGVEAGRGMIGHASPPWRSWGARRAVAGLARRRGVGSFRDHPLAGTFAAQWEMLRRLGVTAGEG